MGHTYSNLLFHVISATKDRVPQITADIRPRLDSYIGGIVRKFRGVLLEAGGVDDHSHWLISARPDTARPAARPAHIAPALVWLGLRLSAAYFLEW